MQLATNEDDLDDVLMPMPQFAESVQRNNPLIQRLKFQNRSRAHTRAQLEAAAKSEGGVYKTVAGQASAKDGQVGGAGSGALAIENIPGGAPSSRGQGQGQQAQG